MTAVVCRDFNSRTCIELERDGNTVSLIPLEITGMQVVKKRVSEFDKIYKPIPGYPVEKAAGLYKEYAVTLGGTLEAMKALSKLTTVSEEEIKMATKTKSMFDDKSLMDKVQKEIDDTAKKRATKDKTAPAKVTESKGVTKTPAAAKGKASAPAPAAKGKATPPSKPAPAAKGKAPAPAAAAKSKAVPAKGKAAAASDGEHKSASAMFKDLIMNNKKLTDDQIFAQVQEKFGLDDNKRGYVKWYRKDLAKKGLNPPDEVK